MKERINRPDINFTQIPNELILNEKISGSGFRLLAYIYSKPNNWRFYRKNISKELNWTLSKLDRIIVELKKVGVLETIQHISYTEWIIKPLSKTTVPTIKNDSTPLSKMIVPPIKNDSPYNSNTEKSNTELNNTEKRKNLFLEFLPEKLNYPEFLEKWEEWIIFRKKELKKPITITSAKSQFKMLSNESNPISVIDKSIMNGYQGLIPEKSKTFKTGKKGYVGHNVHRFTD